MPLKNVLQLRNIKHMTKEDPCTQKKLVSQLFQAFRACLSYRGMSRHALGFLVLCPSNGISLSIFLLLPAKAFPAEQFFS